MSLSNLPGWFLWAYHVVHLFGKQGKIIHLFLLVRVCRPALPFLSSAMSGTIRARKALGRRLPGPYWLLWYLVLRGGGQRFLLQWHRPRETWLGKWEAVLGVSKTWAKREGEMHRQLPQSGWRNRRTRRLLMLVRFVIRIACWAGHDSVGSFPGAAAGAQNRSAFVHRRIGGIAGCSCCASPFTRGVPLCHY